MNNLKINQVISIFTLLLTLILSACEHSDNNDGGKPVASPDGKWIGTVEDNYHCEGGSSAVEFTINGNDLSITRGGNPLGTGTLVSDGGNNDKKFNYTNAGGTNLLGRLSFDPSYQYALIVMQDSAGGNSGVTGILQKTSPTNTAFSVSDLVASWKGASIQFDSSFNFQSGDESNINILNTASGVQLSGNDGPLVISDTAPNIIYSSSSSFVSSNSVMWGTASKFAIFVQSLDKHALAAGFIDGDCNYSLLNSASGQKFFLWTRN